MPIKDIGLGAWASFWVEGGFLAGAHGALWFNDILHICISILHVCVHKYTPYAVLPKSSVIDECFIV